MLSLFLLSIKVPFISGDSVRKVIILCMTLVKRIVKPRLLV